MADAHFPHAPALGRDFKVQKPDRILTLSCEDRPSIVHTVSGVLYRCSEAVVLARARRLHIERRMMPAGRRTVIFR